ncbi:hypothetical protein TNIN_26811 [Trichonephila inaurata madagascariensis]|uniref:Uncharacterized protein n=1 Tax=Trichonephila inaurata madagascariensis TaxID=2747483 RepID=A0A8X6XYU4_9ARAC|nr:hypothetical protein TNIN_26811 [Trichonephila inaurata madagascariensis]
MKLTLTDSCNLVRTPVAAVFRLWKSPSETKTLQSPSHSFKSSLVLKDTPNSLETRSGQFSSSAVSGPSLINRKPYPILTIRSQRDLCN